MPVNVNEVAWYVGVIPVLLEDFARAIAVQEAKGEEFKAGMPEWETRMQDARDVCDRAFRYASVRYAER